jgi:hypothetical protein
MKGLFFWGLKSQHVSVSRKPMALSRFKNENQEGETIFINR